ncbi:MAG: radical SAM protein, partial [bacterium]|nr:radical SAM protein [Candidatus Colisoma equi]
MKFLIHTYGCQMNVRDSEAVEALLIESGHVKAASEDEAELVIVNSCTVRQKAEEKAIGKAGNLIAAGKITGMLGCAVRRLGPDLFKKLPRLAFAVAPGELLKIPYITGGDPLSAHTTTSNLYSAFVTVMTGCDNCCSYCIVPTVRGHEHSRPADDIVREVKCLAARGVKEVTLLGQSVLRYRGFPQLLRRINEING